MQATPAPQPKPSSTRKWVSIGIALAIGFCCVIAAIALTLSNGTTPTPTQPEGPSGTVVDEPPATTGPQPTQAPTQPVLGATRDQPVPKNTTVDIGDGMRATVLEVTRPADDIVEQGNMFNDTPAPNVQEYVLVKLRVECTKSSNEKCSFNSYEFKTVGADGQIHDPASAAGIPQPFEPFAEFFGGATLEGNIAYLVTQGDSTVVLFHDPLFLGDPIYIALQ